MQQVFRAFFLIFLFLFEINACRNAQNEDLNPFNPPEFHTLNAIKERGALNIVTSFSPIGYFVYDGEPKGFHYEIMKEYARHLGVSLHVFTVPNVESGIQNLTYSRFDMLVMDLMVTDQKPAKIDLTIPIHHSSVVTVRRKNNASVKNVSFFTRKGMHPDTYVMPYNLSLYNYFMQKGPDIKTVLIDTSGQMEILIEKVIRSEVQNIVTYEHIVKVYKRFSTGLEIIPISSSHIDFAWGVALGADELRSDFNKWFAKFRKTKQYAFIYYKYYESPYADNIRMYRVTKQKKSISPFDELLKKYAPVAGWKWQLMAAIMYEESHFKPDLRSKRGAFGLMQFMPETAAMFGIDTNSSAEQQIQAAAKLIKYLNEQFVSSVPDSRERAKFVIASYNSGLGHIYDAQRIAVKLGKDSSRWTGQVDSCLLLKSMPVIYKDPMVRNGHFFGKQTTAFVENVMERYLHFLNATKP